VKKLERMFERLTTTGNWHRIERVGNDGRVLDYVEVGECDECGRGVDRMFPSEYRLVAGTLVCAGCQPTSRGELEVTPAVPALPAFLRARAPTR
jgi:hypothetical protein